MHLSEREHWRANCQQITEHNKIQEAQLQHSALAMLQ